MNIHEIADVFSAHKKEILTLARRSSCRHGLRVMAEVTKDGVFRYAEFVLPGVGSWRAREGRAYACFFDCNPFLSYSDINNRISEWVKQQEEWEQISEHALKTDQHA